MQIAIQVAGYDMAKADALQHAVSKKNPEELKTHRETFISGAVENGVEKATAERLFGMLENFTGYGFNKAHAIAYAYTARFGCRTIAARDMARKMSTFILRAALKATKKGRK